MSKALRNSIHTGGHIGLKEGGCVKMEPVGSKWLQSECSGSSTSQLFTIRIQNILEEKPVQQKGIQ